MTGFGYISAGRPAALAALRSTVRSAKCEVRLEAGSQRAAEEFCNKLISTRSISYSMRQGIFNKDTASDMEIGQQEVMLSVLF